MYKELHRTKIFIHRKERGEKYAHNTDSFLKYPNICTSYLIVNVTVVDLITWKTQKN